MTEINTLVDEFTGDVPKPRLGFVNRKAATTALKEAFKQGNVKLEEMDILVDMLSDSDDELKLNAYNGYKNARIVVNTGSRKKRKTAAVWGRVIDFETGLPIAGARVSIPGTSIVVVTLEDGSFRIALKSFGIYQLRIEMDGYKMHLEEEINVTAEMEEVVIELEKVTV